jgi:PAS domain S-box-containing protein
MTDGGLLMAKKRSYEELEQRIKELEREGTQCSRAAEELRREHSLFIGGPVVVFTWLTTENWPAVYVSPNVTQFGYQANDFVSGTIPYIDIIHREDLDRVLSEVEEYTESGVPFYEQEYRIIQADGKTKWMYDYTIVRRNDQGEITHYDGYIIDITERKRAEDELRSSLEREQLLGDIIRNASVAIGICYPDGRLGICNTAFQELTGYREEELRIIDWNAVLTPPEWRRHESAKLEELHSTKRSVYYEKECIHKDGSIVPIEVVNHPRLDNDGNIESYFGFITDITQRKRLEEKLTKHQERLEKLVEERTAELTKANEQLKQEIDYRKRAEEALRETEEKLRTFMDSVTDFFAITDKDENLVYVNRSMVDVLGYSKEEMTGMHISQIISQESMPNFISEVEELVEKGKLCIETTWLTKDGSKIHGELNVNAIYHRDGNYKGSRGVFRDITERKQSKEALESLNEELLSESRKRRQLSKRLIDLLERERQRIATDLHDHVGQRLTILKMDLEKIKAQLKPADTLLTDRIQAAINKTVQTIKDTKNISYGLRPSILDNLGLVPTVHALLDDIKLHSNLRINFFSRNIPQRFDTEKQLAIYRIIQEAMTNIMKHARAEKVFVNLIKRGEILSLSVEDDGIGFKPSEVADREERKGTTGLLIMQERVAQLAGEFSVESRIGRGAHLLAEIPF